MIINKPRRKNKVETILLDNSITIMDVLQNVASRQRKYSTKLYRCPRNGCMRSFDTQRGLTVHFNNCNKGFQLSGAIGDGEVGDAGHQYAESPPPASFSSPVSSLSPLHKAEEDTDVSSVSSNNKSPLSEAKNSHTSMLSDNEFPAAEYSDKEDPPNEVMEQEKSNLNEEEKQQDMSSVSSATINPKVSNEYFMDNSSISSEESPEPKDNVSSEDGVAAPKPGDPEVNLPHIDFLAWAKSRNIDPSLYHLWHDHHEYGYKSVPLDPFQKYYARVLKAVQDMNAPLSAFDTILGLARDAQTLQKSGFEVPKRVSRKGVIDLFKMRHNLKHLEPTEIPVVLPGSKESVKITVHDFYASLCSLLSNPHLMRDENLCFFEDEEGFSYGKPPVREDPDDIFDIYDGDVYGKGFTAYVKVAGDLFVPIIFFIDKTFKDRNGRLTLEPLCFTLGIFKKELRRRREFWRPLGYIHNQDNIRVKLTAIKKAEDYHYVIGILLSKFKEAQELDGIAWQLTFKGKTYSVSLKIPILFIMGDTEGHDKLCGKYNARTRNVKCLCRYCNCPTNKSGDCISIRRAGWKYTRAPMIASLVSQGREEELQEMSYRSLLNAFTGLHFCDPKRGINGATPSELLHVLQHGLYLYYNEGLYGAQRTKKTKPAKAARTSNS